MRFGYWMPVFGGWLRNVPGRGMEASWDYVKRLTQRSEADRLGHDGSPSRTSTTQGRGGAGAGRLSTAAALAAVTRARADGSRFRPNFHHRPCFAKQAANIDNISGGRLALNVVSSGGRRRAAIWLQFDEA
jgi:FMNH2-dependent dimethyl sulfone monooxygenase